MTSKAVKADSGKPPARYFYFTPMALFHGPESTESRMAVCFEEFLNKIIGGNIRGARNSLALFSAVVTTSLSEDLKMTKADVFKSVSYVSELGSRKYGIFNYQKGMKWSRLIDALGRHFIHHLCDDYIDEESGKDHRFHILANILMLMYYLQHNIGENNLTEESNNEQDTE